MDMQHDAPADEPKQEWVTPELVKMDVSTGTLNAGGFGGDGIGQSSS